MNPTTFLAKSHPTKSQKKKREKKQQLYIQGYVDTEGKLREGHGHEPLPASCHLSGSLAEEQSLGQRGLLKARQPGLQNILEEGVQKSTPLDVEPPTSFVDLGSPFMHYDCSPAPVKNGKSITQCGWG